MLSPDTLGLQNTLLYFANQRAEHKETKPLFAEAAEQPEPGAATAWAPEPDWPRMPGPISPWKLATPTDPEHPLAPLALLLRCQNGSRTVLLVPQCHLHFHSHLLRFWAMRPEKTPSYLTAVALESSAPNPKKEYTCS